MSGIRVLSFVGLGLTIILSSGAPVAVYVDRRAAGRSWADNDVFFADRYSNILMAEEREDGNNAISLHVIVDRSLIELFANGGVVSAVSNVFWDDEAIPERLDVLLGDGLVTLESLSVQRLNGTWECAA